MTYAAPSRWLSTLAMSAGALASSPALAMPVNISNAAYAGTFVRDCRSVAARAAGATTPDRCEATNNFAAAPGVSTFVERRFDATLGGFTAQVQATHALGVDTAGATRSSVDASGPAGDLILRQATLSSTPYGRASGHSVALQSFQWTGATGVTRAVGGTLDFTAENFVTSDPMAPPSSAPRTFAQASIRIFSLTSATFEIDSDFVTDLSRPDFVGAASSAAGYRDEGGATVVNVPGTSCDSSGHCEYTWSYNFTVENGRYYFVESWLGLWSLFGSDIDATHTFVTQLGERVSDGQGGTTFVADSSGFAAAAPLANPVGLGNAVSLPGSLALSMLGLGLLWRRRVR